MKATRIKISTTTFLTKFYYFNTLHPSIKLIYSCMSLIRLIHNKLISYTATHFHHYHFFIHTIINSGNIHYIFLLQVKNSSTQSANGHSFEDVDSSIKVA